LGPCTEVWIIARGNHGQRVINVDGYWIYAVAGWEGYVHDGQVFNGDLLRRLPVFEGKYNLGGRICFASVCSGPLRWRAVPSQGMEES
jgi:hypothetical protein